MITFLQENLATILIGTVILLTVICIVIGLKKNRKNGKAECSGYGCDHCPSAYYCRKQ